MDPSCASLPRGQPNQQVSRQRNFGAKTVLFWASVICSHMGVVHTSDPGRNVTTNRHYFVMRIPPGDKADWDVAVRPAKPRLASLCRPHLAIFR